MIRKRLSMVTGFVTNSSSVVYGFDKKILKNDKVKALFEKHGVRKGFVGGDLLQRSDCTSILLNEKDIEAAREGFKDSFLLEEGLSAPVDLDPNKIYFIYGDEYESIASDLCYELQNIINEENLKIDTFRTDYN